MSQNIHSTAIIEEGAEIAEDVRIGAFSYIGPHVKIGAGCEVKTHAVIAGKTTIGQNCQIHAFASIGGPPQDLKYEGEPSELLIGDHNVIREYVTMNPGTKEGGMKTVIGSNSLFMIGAHVAHDCRVGDHVILANNAALAGHVSVGDHAIIGGLSAVHQYVRIGPHAIIGGMSGVENDVIPYGRVKGDRASLAGLNLVGLERRGFSKDQIKTLQQAFKQMFNGHGTLEERINEVARDFSNDDSVMAIVEFARQKTRFPLCQPAKR